MKNNTFIVIIVSYILLVSCTNNTKQYYFLDYSDYGVRFEEAKYGNRYFIGGSKVAKKEEDQKDYGQDVKYNTIFYPVGKEKKITSEEFNKLKIVRDRLEFYRQFREKDSIFFITKNSDATYNLQYVKEEVFLSP